MIVFQPLYCDVNYSCRLSFSKSIGYEYDFDINTSKTTSLGDKSICLGLIDLEIGNNSAAVRTFDTNELRDEYYTMLIYLIKETKKHLSEYYPPIYYMGEFQDSIIDDYDI